MMTTAHHTADREVLSCYNSPKQMLSSAQPSKLARDADPCAWVARGLPLRVSVQGAWPTRLNGEAAWMLFVIRTSAS
jgi:hypothetical protein